MPLRALDPESGRGLFSFVQACSSLLTNYLHQKGGRDEMEPVLVLIFLPLKLSAFLSEPFGINI